MKESNHRSWKGWLDRFCDGTELFFRALGGVAGAILAILLLWIVDPTDWHLLSLPLLPLVAIIGFSIGFFYDSI
jgi:presenilin-like A22 family membrane protease